MAAVAAPAPAARTYKTFKFTESLLLLTRPPDAIISEELNYVLDLLLPEANVPPRLCPTVALWQQRPWTPQETLVKLQPRSALPPQHLLVPATEPASFEMVATAARPHQRLLPRRPLLSRKQRRRRRKTFLKVRYVAVHLQRERLVQVYATSRVQLYQGELQTTVLMDSDLWLTITWTSPSASDHRLHPF